MNDEQFDYLLDIIKKTTEAITIMAVSVTKNRETIQELETQLKELKAQLQETGHD